MEWFCLRSFSYYFIAWLVAPVNFSFGFTASPSVGLFFVQFGTYQPLCFTSLQLVFREYQLPYHLLWWFNDWSVKSYKLSFFFNQASPYSRVMHPFWKLVCKLSLCHFWIQWLSFCSYFNVVQALYKALTPFYIVRLIQTTGSYRTTQELAWRTCGRQDVSF